MPSPSAIAVWVSPLALRMRRMRGPAKIFCSAMGEGWAIGARKGWRGSTPLCPAGNLLGKAGDWPAAQSSPIADLAGRAAAPELPIFPLEGEMSGRTEGGNAERCHIHAIYSF